VLAVIDWTNVLVALIAGLPAIIAALASLHIRQQLRTPSGTSIGKQVENVQHTALSNYYRLHSLTRGLDMPEAVEAEREAELIEGVQNRRKEDG
jgi:hypothetical protein